MRNDAIAAEYALPDGLAGPEQLNRGWRRQASQERPVTLRTLADNVAVADRAITFHELYERYAQDVYRFAYWLTGNPDDAKDITSETFVKALTAEAEPRAETVKAYLFTIARNLHRKQWRRTSRFEPMDGDYVDPSAHPDVAAADREELDRAMAAIANLPELDRTVLLLRVEENMSYEEIAAVTGISATAAKVKVFRARSRLAARLQSER